MKLRRDDDKALMDFMEPEVAVAQFMGLTPKAMDTILIMQNFGEDAFHLWRSYRDTRDIASVVKFLKELDDLYRDYDYELYCAERQG